MSYSSSRRSSGTSGTKNWSRKAVRFEEAKVSPSPKKTKNSDPPSISQRSITSYFAAKPSAATLGRKSVSALPSTSHGSSILTSPTSTPKSATPASSSSLEVTQPTEIIDLDDVGDSDSQKTEVLAQWEPLMSEALEQSQSQPASAVSLYYLDEIDSILQFYDVDAAATLTRFKKPAKLDRVSTEPVMDAGAAYYLSNFMAILMVVEEKDSHLFSPEELEVFRVLRTSPVSEQKLFSRLLYRKGPWFQCPKLNYSDITDIPAAVTRLLANGIFEEPSSVVDILPTLNNQQLRQLTKSASGLKREQLLTVATKWVSTQRTVDGRPIRAPKEVGQCIRIKEYVDVLFKRVHRLFFLNQVEDQTTLILIHTGQIKFPTYLIPEKEESSSRTNENKDRDRWIHDSVMSYELSASQAQEEGPTPPGSPTSSQRDLGDFLFPSSSATGSNLKNIAGTSDADSKFYAEELENVDILRKIGFHSVFRTREELDEYEAALQMSHQLTTLLGSEIDVDNDTTDNEKRKKQTPNAKNLNDEALVEAAMEIVEDAVLKYQLKESERTANKDVLNMSQEQLGAHLFLNRFSAKWVYSSIIWVGVSLLERQKKYKEAVGYLKMLLNQFEVNRGRRGDWWIRLVFDVSHLKESDHAIDLCVQAIQDDNCRPQHLLKLYDKLRILLKAKLRDEAKEEKSAIKKQKEQDKLDEVTPTPKRRGRSRMTPSPKPSAKPASPVRLDQKYETEDADDQAEFTPKKKLCLDVIPDSSSDTASSAPQLPKQQPIEPPSTPILRTPSPTTTQKGRRRGQLDPIPLPSDTLLAEQNVEILRAVDSITPEKTIGALDDRSIPGRRSRSPVRGSSPSPNVPVSPSTPSIRHTSPLRYQSPTRTISPNAGAGIEKNALTGRSDFDEDGDENAPCDDTVDILDLSAEIAERMKALGVPLPEQLRIGKVETISGPMGPKSPSASGWGNRSVFIGYDGNPCGVEEYSLQYYQQEQGWPRGMHCEGSPYFALFTLLFWDIIFDASVPYVFQTPYQDAPLDMTTEAFYLTRKSAIDQRLHMIYFSSDDIRSPVLRKIEDSYFKWHGRSARGIDWSTWKIFDLVDIARCLGGPVLALLCERFATDFRFTHSGLPDLLLWNPKTNKAKLVEVKGPGDKLSEKQKIWIDALAQRGCDICTLYVKKREEKPQVADTVEKVVELDQAQAVESSSVLAETKPKNVISPKGKTPLKSKLVVVDEEEE